MMESPKRRKDDEMEKKLRQVALKGIIAAIRGDRGNSAFFNPDNIEGPLKGHRREASLPPDGNELEEVSDGARSFPLTPRSKKLYDNPLLGNFEDMRAKP